MPLDLNALWQAITETGALLAAGDDALQERRARARAWLEALGREPDMTPLRQKIASLAAAAELRCAIPLGEPVTAHVPLPAAPPSDRVIIAVDGSQIYPDRHSALPFGLINLGGIILYPDASRPPDTPICTELLFDEKLYTGESLPDEDALSLSRDLKERQFLLEQARQTKGVRLALIDGPLELWSGGRSHAPAYQQAVSAYLDVLAEMQQVGIILAGYVDKPSANLVARMLEVHHFGDEPARFGKYHPLAGVSDRWLFGERRNPLLGAGERSAVFGLQSAGRTLYTGDLSLCFFYLNVGSETHPWPVRVEIPRWVAADRQALDALHYTLVEQARQLSLVAPYPYVLLRAHEEALITHAEKQQIEQLLYNELQRHRLPVDEPSAKQSSKDAGRSRV